jgi:hypothetical protein
MVDQREALAVTTRLTDTVYFVSPYGAFNYTGDFFWPFPKKITVASISMTNYQDALFHNFHVGSTYPELFYYTKCFFFRF